MVATVVALLILLWCLTVYEASCMLVSARWETMIPVYGIVGSSFPPVQTLDWEGVHLGDESSCKD